METTVGKEQVSLAYSLQSIEGSQGKNSRQGPETQHRGGMLFTGLLALAYSATFLLYSRPILPTVGWLSFIVKEKLHRLI